jgi:hypothetical protein
MNFITEEEEAKKLHRSARRGRRCLVVREAGGRRAVVDGTAVAGPAAVEVAAARCSVALTRARTHGVGLECDDKAVRSTVRCATISQCGRFVQVSNNE